MFTNIVRSSVRMGMRAARGKMDPLKSFKVREFEGICGCMTNTKINFACSISNDARHGHKRDHKYDHHSDSESDHELLGHRGESPFWRRKMRTVHAILDVNNDGVISYDDFKLLADRFVNLGHLSEKHQKEFKKALKNLWEALWGEITPYNLVTVEQYLDDMHHVLNDKALSKKAHKFLPYFFRAVDRDNSGEIKLEEFKLFFECLGLKEEDAIVAFHSIDGNSDGKINLQEFVQHGRDFFIAEDEERVSKYFWGPLVEPCGH